MNNVINFPDSKQSTLRDEIFRGLDIIEKSAGSKDPKINKLRKETTEQIIQAVKAI